MDPGSSAQRALTDAIEAAEERAAGVAAALSVRQAALPLRYWRQAAHYTVPADDATRARKALEEGTAPMVRLMERFGIGASELATRLGADVSSVETLLSAPPKAPLVMFDGEDAQAPGEEAAAATLRNVVDIVGRPSTSGTDAAAPLRFFRPPGPGDRQGLRILLSLLSGLAGRRDEEAQPDRRDRLPLDGIVLPKVRHPEEVDLVDHALRDAERELGLAEHSIRIALLVESGWAVAQLPRIAARAVDRLSALIYGPVDHASDVGLPTIAPDHPVALAARVTIVNVAGAIGVPAIDGMTLAYPVADPTLDASANRERFLERVALVHEEARAARALGMLGKWVGHPAQLFAVMLAFDEGFDARQLEDDATTLEAYRASASAGQGAVIIEGEMADRATDRHARMRLRRAVAAGRFDPDRALALEVIEAGELDEARGLGGPMGARQR